MIKLKKLEDILRENEWMYDTNRSMYVFPALEKSVKADTLQARAGHEVSVEHQKIWPACFLEEVKAEDRTYKVKLKDMHIALMMADYKFTQNGVVFILNDSEWSYPSALLPFFGDYIEVRKDENGDLVEIGTGAIIHTLLIESVVSSHPSPLTFLDLLRLI